MINIYICSGNFANNFDHNAVKLQALELAIHCI